MQQLNKTYNIYCDESSYLENDLHRYMLLGAIRCPYHLLKQYTKDMQSLKDSHHFFAEIKWTNVSRSKITFYLALLDWFLTNTELRFRTLIVDKKQLKHDLFDQTHDLFYYKMYYYLLNYDINSQNSYNVYLDIKDNRSAKKVRRLSEILNTKYGVFRNIQNVRSHEVMLIQLTDFLMGAVAYKNNFPEMPNKAKKTLVDHIEHKLKINLSTLNWNEKFNLFFIDLNKMK